MKLLNVKVQDDFIIEDYELDVEDPDLTLRILDNKRSNRTAYLGFKDRYISYSDFEKIVSNNFSSKEITTFKMKLEPHVDATDNSRATIKEVNYFIELGCLSMGKDRMLELIENNTKEIKECLQKQPQLPKETV